MNQRPSHIARCALEVRPLTDCIPAPILKSVFSPSGQGENLGQAVWRRFFRRGRGFTNNHVCIGSTDTKGTDRTDSAVRPGWPLDSVGWDGEVALEGFQLLVGCIEIRAGGNMTIL